MNKGVWSKGSEYPQVVFYNQTCIQSFVRLLDVFSMIVIIDPLQDVWEHACVSLNVPVCREDPLVMEAS